MSVQLFRGGVSALVLILCTPALCQTALPTITVGAARRIASPRPVVSAPTQPVQPVVQEEKPKPVAEPPAPIANLAPATSDAAQLLQKTPGVSMYESGGVSRLPAIHGMADDRLKILVGGVKTTSACANHMNPPLSYVDPNNIDKIDVHSGVMSVSNGGDSIGGSIIVTPRSPVFAPARALGPQAAPTPSAVAPGVLGAPTAVVGANASAANAPAPASWPVVPNWPLHGKGERFGSDGQVFVSGLISSFFRTVNNGVGVSGTANVATEHYSLLYNGAWQRATNYHAGDNGPKVLSTGFISENHAATLAYQNDGHLLSLRGSIQNIPYQGFVNQRMDMTKNRSYQFNGKYLGAFDWGIVDFNAFYQYTFHQMNMLRDKQIDNMPMATNGKDFGYTLKIEHKVDDNNLVRLGSEFHGFRLNDYWEPIPDYCAQSQCLGPGAFKYAGYGGGLMFVQDYTTLTTSGGGTRSEPMGMLMMGPETQWNIRDGKRDRVAHYAEWLRKWSPEWSTELGLRNEIVMMNSGNAQPYDWRDPAPMPMLVSNSSGFFWDRNVWRIMQMSNPDSPAAFRYNQRNRARVDINFDLTARAKYEPDPFSTYEFGYSRKTRSPNLYERYAWVVGSMSTAMINWFGDGNGYTGNLDLKPEVAHTFGITGSWRDPNGNWEARVAPYFSYIENYINADRYQDFRFTGTGRPGPYTFSMLYFRNHRAIIYGFDISGRLKLLDSPDYGLFTGTAMVNYTYGRDLDIGNVQNCNGFLLNQRPSVSTLLADQACYANAGNVDKGDALYNIMPLNARIGVEHRLGGWSSGVDLQLVDSKTHVSIQRNEQKTPAYALLNLRTSYEWENMRIDLALENVTDQRYYPALGGFYFTGYKYFTNTGQAPLGIAGPVPGPGRNFVAGLTVKF